MEKYRNDFDFMLKLIKTVNNFKTEMHEQFLEIMETLFNTLNCYIIFNDKIVLFSNNY